MNSRTKRFFAALLLSIIAVVAVTGSSVDAANTVVRFETDMGDIHVRMLDAEAQVTVDNFLRYIADGSYEYSIFHRLHFSTDPDPASPTYGEPNLEVLQGGGFTYYPDYGPYFLPTYEGIADNYGRPHIRGTISMAKSSAPNSTTRQFFFNLNDVNVDVLDPPDNNGGFMVFGYVIGDGMNVVDMLSGVAPNPVGEVSIQNFSIFADDPNDYWPQGNPYWNHLSETPVIDTPNGLSLEWIYSISVVGVDGDADFDGDCDDDDYAVFVASFGEQGIGLAADFDGDYDVDLADFAVFRESYSGAASSPFPEPGLPVPEPTGICLLGLGSLAMLRRRRRAS